MVDIIHALRMMDLIVGKYLVCTLKYAMLRRRHRNALKGRKESFLRSSCQGDGDFVLT
jgi:hypothetical protein